MAVHTCSMHLLLFTQASKGAQGLQMQLVQEVLAFTHEAVLQAAL